MYDPNILEMKLQVLFEDVDTNIKGLNWDIYLQDDFHPSKGGYYQNTIDHMGKVLDHSKDELHKSLDSWLKDSGIEL